MIPIGGERFGGQVPQIVGLRRGPERAHSSMGERGPQKQGREMGCMGAEDPSAIRTHSSNEAPPQTVEHSAQPGNTGTLEQVRAKRGSLCDPSGGRAWVAKTGRQG